MIKAGITGGIGSGKSTVAKIFEVLGAPVYYADDASKKLMNENEGLKVKIQELFGKETYVNGVLNRKHLAAHIFNDSKKLEQLNNLVHPVVIQDAHDWMQKQTAPYAIKEAALIFESGSQAQLDYVIGVYAPISLCVQRVMQRNKTSREEVLQRMNTQIDQEIKMRLCDFVIKNDEQTLLIPQVLAIHEKFIRIANTC